MYSQPSIKSDALVDRNYEACNVVGKMLLNCLRFFDLLKNVDHLRICQSRVRALKVEMEVKSSYIDFLLIKLLLFNTHKTFLPVFPTSKDTNSRPNSIYLYALVISPLFRGSAIPGFWSRLLPTVTLGFSNSGLISPDSRNCGPPE